jgi:hypothetical protein
MIAAAPQPSLATFRRAFDLFRARVLVREGTDLDWPGGPVGVDRHPVVADRVRPTRMNPAQQCAAVPRCAILSVVGGAPTAPTSPAAR